MFFESPSKDQSVINVGHDSAVTLQQLHHLLLKDFRHRCDAESLPIKGIPAKRSEDVVSLHESGWSGTDQNPLEVSSFEKKQ